MKIKGLVAFILALLVCTSVPFYTFAEESSDDDTSSEAPAPVYDYVIKYGYTPIVSYDGSKPADYIKGSTPKTSYVNAGDSHVVSDNYYSWREYVFIGWRAGGKLYQPGEVIYNINSNITFIAEWARGTRPDMTVHGILSYSKNGKVTETVSVPIGQTVKLNEGTWQDSYGRVFEGGTSFLMSFTTVELAEPTLGTDTVSVKYDGGVTSGIQGKFTIRQGNSFVVDGCYGTKEGYTFTGWSDGKGRVYLAGDTCNASEDVTLTAIWRENEKPAPDYRTVNLSVGEGGSSDLAGRSTVEKGDSFSFTVKADEGYKLISVICDGAELGTGGTYTLTVNADMNISASFEKLPENAPDISEEPSVGDGASTEEESENGVASEEESGASSPKDDGEKGGSFTKILVIALAAVVCVGSIVFASKATAKNRKRR